MKIPEFASHWARALGAKEDSLEPLSGGINNSVFACTSGNNSWVIKGYPQFNTLSADRMQAEVEFLKYASEVARGFTPTLVAVDTVRRCTIMEHIAGHTYSEGVRPSREEIENALSFFKKLNSNNDLAKTMVRLDAAEGFLSMRQHMKNVDERIAAMGTEHLPASFKERSGIILRQLRSKAEKLSIRLEDKIKSGTIEDCIRSDERCISPSDFGFHNAIRTCTGVVFIDFEFAGWDDPAKCCVDFTLQQRNPVDLDVIDVASILFPDRVRRISNRLNAMNEVLLLKWHCIILNILNPEKLFRLVGEENGSTQSLNLIISRQLMRYLRYSEAHHGI